MNTAPYPATPWRVSEWAARDTDGAVECGGLQVVDANGHLISATTIEDATEEEESAVRLIAAAPELLNALQAALRAMNNECDPDEYTTPFATIRAAIAKATGA